MKWVTDVFEFAQPGIVWDCLYNVNSVKGVKNVNNVNIVNIVNMHMILKHPISSEMQSPAIIASIYFLQNLIEAAHDFKTSI